MPKKDFKILSILFLLIIGTLIGFIVIGSVKADIDSSHHKESMNFPYYQFIENNGEIANVSEIEIALPSPSWNLTHLEINFTDIRLKEEEVTIEDNPTDFYTVDKFQHQLAVQINITEPTIIYSVDIYADVVQPSLNPIYIQINGYDTPTQKPNNTIIYDPVELNISSNPDWYRQTFNNPSTLNPGYYALIFNGAGIGNAPQPLYRWFNNIENANHPDLLIWTNNGASWSTGIANQPFLHKFIQKTNKIFNPEDLKMQVELDNDTYSISNGVAPGTGNITIDNINFSSQDSILNIPIITNKTIELSFNCSYYFRLKTKLSTSGFVTISFNNDNVWNTSFIVNKVFLNNSIEFYYPSNWQQISIYQNNIRIDPSLNNVTNTITINEDLLIDGASISIIANTIQYDFDLDIRTTDFNLDQELKFSVANPIPGNYTFILYDSLGYNLEDSIQTIKLPADNNLFRYHIPASAKEGVYRGYVYFFDGFNAGVEITSFNIHIPILITLSIILISSAIGVSAIGTSYVIIKKYKRKKEEKKKAIYDKFIDILNLSHIMISEKKSSLNVYEQSFTAKSIDTTLISGFLSAIRTFGIELTNAEDATQTIKLEYKNSKILMSEFKDFRIVLIMNDNPSRSFLESVKELSLDIDSKYGKLLESFKGNVQPFLGIEELLKTHLNTSFLYPLKIVKTGKAKINQLEKNIITRAQDNMKKRNSTYFYISYLLEEKSLDSKEIELVFNLLDKKIFQPVI